MNRCLLWADGVKSAALATDTSQIKSSSFSKSMYVASVISQFHVADRVELR